MRRVFINNINDILKDGMVESIPLEKIELLKSIFQDKELFNKLYTNFSNYFVDDFEYDDLYMKTEDFIYRLHYAVNKWLVPIHHIKDSEIIDTLHDLVDRGIDLYGSVSYDDYDKTMLDEFEEIYQGKEYRV